MERDKKYYVCSYGGCASKAFASFLGGNTAHLHDRYPPSKLTQADGLYFSHKPVDPTNCAVVYLVRDPVECILSKFSRNHHLNIQVPNYLESKYSDPHLDKSVEGSDGRGKEPEDAMNIWYYEAELALLGVLQTKSGSRWKNVEVQLRNENTGELVDSFLQHHNETFARFINYGKDVCGYEDFFINYVNRKRNKNYPIYVVNYHKMWDERGLIYDTLGINKSKPFFERRETNKKVDLPADALKKLEKTFSGLSKKIKELPAITKIEPNGSI